MATEEKKIGKDSLQKSDDDEQVPEIKLVALGEGGVGKSALVIRLVTNNFLDEFDPTIEDSYRKSVDVDDREYLLDILDTGGSEAFSSMQDQWIREGQAFLVVYSITNRYAFGEAKIFREKILRCKEEEDPPSAQNPPIVLVGNKCDLEDHRKVPKSAGQNLAKEWGDQCRFVEISARDSTQDDIAEIFRTCVRLLMAQGMVKAGKPIKPKPIKQLKRKLFDGDDIGYDARLNDVVIDDAFNDIVLNIKDKSTKTVKRSFSSQKREFAERALKKRINEIPNEHIADALDYAFKLVRSKELNEYKTEIFEWFKQHKIDSKRDEFINNILDDCINNSDDGIIKALQSMYMAMGNYAEYKSLQNKLLKANKSDTAKDDLISVKIQERRVYFDKIILQTVPKQEYDELDEKYDEVEAGMKVQQTLNEIELETVKRSYTAVAVDTSLQTNETMKISITDQCIYYNCTKNNNLGIGDKLCKINDDTLIGMDVCDIIKIIEYEPLSFTLYFERDENKKCCATTAKKSSATKRNPFKDALINFMKLSLNILTKASSLLDAITDIILLTKAAESNALYLTMILFLTLLAPYILSYSSGVQIFLYRRTFSDVQLLTFKSLLLALYLFPTGIVFFILLDVVDALLELYKWCGFGLLNKIKNEAQMIKIESSVAEYFGMSRMDWHSFKKQKLIAQLFFETVPQAILQMLLFFSIIQGVDDTTITQNDLILSLCSAAFNCLLQILLLLLESKAVNEGFVQYSLHCITARFGWIPFEQQIRTASQNEINFKIKYDLPIVTYLSQTLLGNSKQTLSIADDANYSFVEINEFNAESEQYKKLMNEENKTIPLKGAFGSIEYDFSYITISKLITIIKELPKEKGQNLTIWFGESLRLLGVRPIIRLMQICSEKGINLADIDRIDWDEPFSNFECNDPRLFSFTFDEQRKPLLISLYLSGYGSKNDYFLLKQFVAAYDVPINERDDNGNSIVHIMIDKEDYDAIYAFLGALRANQRFYFDERNDDGNSVIHQMVKKNNFVELEQLLNAIRNKSNCEKSLKAFNKFGESALFLAIQNDQKTLKNIKKIKIPSTGPTIYKNLSIDLVVGDVDDDNKEIEDETIMNILHFMVYRIKNEQKKFSDDEKYQKIKEVLVENEQNEIVKAIKYEKPPTIDLLHRLLINDNPEIVRSDIHKTTQQTSFGYILTPTFLEDSGLYVGEIINYLLDANAMINAEDVYLLYALFVHVIKSKADEYNFYFDLFGKIIKQKDVSEVKICDQRKNNLLHFMITQKEKNPINLSTFSYLCKAYPLWMQMKNQHGDIPLLSAIKKKQSNYFFILCRYMAQDILKYFHKKEFVEAMVEWAFELLKNKNVTMIKLLLSVFDYPEIFVWSSNPNKFDPTEESKDVSLINYVSKTNYFQTIDKILFDECSLTKNYRSEFVVTKERTDESLAGNNVDGNVIGLLLQDAVKQETSEQKKDADENDTNEDNELDDGLMTDKSEEDENEPIDWIELVYSTVVETFSALDLVTDIIVLRQLINGNHQWWSTWMLMLLVSPYLVSHGSLVSILQNKIKFEESPFIISFFEFWLITPIALIYLFFIDLVFMIFSLLSTFWLFFVIFCLFVCYQNVKEKAANYDIRDWFESKIFRDILAMNKTEIIGYRRLRTLSQLFFETMPQILLQLRILWVIEIGIDDFDGVNVDTVALSVGLALFHLALEGGMIFFDKSAFQMPFMQYSLECLGGRVQWIPFTNLLQNIVQNQIYIDQSSDMNTFDAKAYEINLNESADDKITLDYENISANVKCVKYKATFQFSPSSMNALAQFITNCPSMVVPSQFNFSKNVIIETLMKSILCKAKIILGRDSLGSADIISLGNLYRASLYKVNLEIDRSKTKLLKNIKADEGTLKPFLNLGETRVLNWFDNINELDIKSIILSNVNRSDNVESIRLDILRRCYLNNFFVANDNESMKVIQGMIEECKEKSVQNESYYFLILFICLYAKGNIFGAHNGEVIMDESLKQTLLNDYLPSYVEINGFKITFSLFESCQCFNDLYRKYVEQILINKCKNFMITSNKIENKRLFSVRDREWDISNLTKETEKLFYLLSKNEIKKWNVPLLDRLVVQSKMLTNYNKYLYHSSAFRQYEPHSFILEVTEPLNVDNIPGFEREKGSQISELIFKHVLLDEDEKEDQMKSEPHPFTAITFNIDNKEKKPKEKEDDSWELNDGEYVIWNKDDDKTSANSLVINEKNIGLSVYNYHLLHSKFQPPPIYIESSIKSSESKFKISVDVKSTKVKKS